MVAEESPKEILKCVQSQIERTGKVCKNQCVERNGKWVKKNLCGKESVMMSPTIEQLKVGAVLRSEDGGYLHDHMKHLGIRYVCVPGSKCE